MSSAYEQEQHEKKHEVWTAVIRWIQENGGSHVMWDGEQYVVSQGHVSTHTHHATREEAYTYALEFAARHFVNKEKTNEQ